MRPAHMAGHLPVRVQPRRGVVPPMTGQVIPRRANPLSERHGNLMYHVNAAKLPGNDVSRTFEGGAHGPSSVSFFLVHNQQGQGPKLHHHPYDETFIILEGRVLVQVGGESIEGGPGDIVIGPPGVPHGFTNLGPGQARLVCIHAAPIMRTEFEE